jgi:hypothetical protein
MRLYSTCVLVVWLAVPASTHQPQERGPSVAAAIHDPTARFTPERAAKAAAERLERPDCQKVLSDFRDASGHTIQARLDRIGDTPRQYLARLTFRDALDHRCRDSARLAFTTVGERDVFICGTQLWQTYRIDPVHVEALIIHEMMHTLGLGENPPSSLEINAGVLKRCW